MMTMSCDPSLWRGQSLGGEIPHPQEPGLKDIASKWGCCLWRTKRAQKGQIWKKGATEAGKGTRGAGQQSRRWLASVLSHCTRPLKTHLFLTSQIHSAPMTWLTNRGSTQDGTPLLASKLEGSCFPPSHLREADFILRDFSCLVLEQGLCSCQVALLNTVGMQNPGHQRRRKRREAKCWGITRLAESIWIKRVTPRQRLGGRARSLDVALWQLWVLIDMDREKGGFMTTSKKANYQCESFWNDFWPLDSFFNWYWFHKAIHNTGVNQL